MKSQPPKKAPKDKQESKKTNGKPTPGKWEEMNRGTDPRPWEFV
jgi:hypothetical protein